MKYNRFTKQSPLVSEIGLGAWQLGVNSGWRSMSEKEAIAMARQSLDYGINFFDTAPNYGHGTSELRLGKALRGIDREKIVVNTKFGHTDSGQLNFDPGYIRESLEGSLKRLQFDYVDSLILHNPPFEYLDGNKNGHYEILERVKDIMDGERNLAQAAISFCLAYDAVSTVIPGSSTIDQLKSNVESVKYPISKELVEQLEYFYQNEVKELGLPW